jgi:hypothetical protein
MRSSCSRRAESAVGDQPSARKGKAEEQGIPAFLTDATLGRDVVTEVTGIMICLRHRFFKMPLTTDFDRIAEELQRELARLWAEYMKAPAEEKAAARARYLAALRRFAAHVNPA